MKMPEILFAAEARGASPRLPKKYAVRTVNLEALLEEAELAPITIVDKDNSEKLSRDKQITRVLAERIKQDSPSHFLVLCVPPGGAGKQGSKAELLKRLPHPERVEFVKDLQDISEVLENLFIKVRVLQERETTPKTASPRPSPLDNVKQVLAATKDLRLSNGKLSADRVAEHFGIALNRLAQWLGRSRQAVTKTPDADSLQQELAYFERVARLRAVVSEEEFQKWLRMPNDQLQGKAPLELLANKQWQLVADLVDDMLTGAST